MSDMIQVTPRVYQLGGIVNVYLLKTSEDELTILDAGLPGSGRRILNAAQELGYGPQAVRHLLITHADTDHVGSLAGLVKATGATVYAGPISKPYIEAAKTPPHLSMIARMTTGALSRLAIRPTQVDQVVDEGDTLPLAEGIEVLRTPGHTEGSLSFYWRAEGVMFVADLLTTRSGRLEPMPAMVTWDAHAVAASTHKVLSMQPEIIAVGHGPAVATKTIKEYISQLQTSVPLTARPVY
ncbi:MAG: MBL fold metallo-hydrolase [Anaerolineaceae bacterium]|nr:MBL fold metallo-hydrolase [Anaerolineae bacterium]MCB9458144.1 MBL fold metallo-hydrolase [Anaerolineaceae bacterium]